LKRLRVIGGASYARIEGPRPSSDDEEEEPSSLRSIITHGISTMAIESQYRCGAAGTTETMKEEPMTRLKYVILFVSDMERSVAFYRDVLGWPLKCQSPERTELAAEDTTLALHHASRPSGAAAVQGEIAGRCQLGLWVDDVEAFHRGMVARGTPCIQPPTADAFGGKLAVYADPDGLPFTVEGGLTNEPRDQGFLSSEP